MGWLANILLIYSWWGIGHRYPHAILVGVGGSILWCIEGFRYGMIDLVTIEIILGLLQLKSWLKWRGCYD